MSLFTIEFILEFVYNGVYTGVSLQSNGLAGVYNDYRAPRRYRPWPCSQQQLGVPADPD